VEHVVQFETNRTTSPRFDMLMTTFRNICLLAWLSSARSVRSTLKWDNERNPRPELYLSRETARPLDGRKEGQMSSQHGPYILGYTHVTMDKAEGLATW
jgi:hypothetical protein